MFLKLIVAVHKDNNNARKGESLLNYILVQASATF